MREKVASFFIIFTSFRTEKIEELRLKMAKIASRRDTAQFDRAVVSVLVVAHRVLV